MFRDGTSSCLPDECQLDSWALLLNFSTCLLISVSGWGQQLEGLCVERGLDTTYGGADPVHMMPRGCQVSKPLLLLPESHCGQGQWVLLGSFVGKVLKRGQELVSSPALPGTVMVSRV